MSLSERVRFVVFKTRVRHEGIGGPNPYRWQDLTRDDLFRGCKVGLFALPGAFTPTCSSNHLPRYEELHQAPAMSCDGVIVKAFVEDHFGDNCSVDPFEVSDADTMLAYLKGEPQGAVSAPRPAFVG